MTGLGVGLLAGSLSGIAFGLVVGVVVGLLAGFVAGVIAASSRSGVDRASSFTPLTAWRNDQRYWLVAGLMVGLLAGILFGLGVDLRAGVVAGIVAGVVVGLISGLVVRFVTTETWPTALAFVQLARRWHTPVRIMRLLEDAHVSEARHQIRRRQRAGHP